MFRKGRISLISFHYFKVLNFSEFIILFYRRMELSKEEQTFMQAMGEVLRMLRHKSGYKSLETFANVIGMDSALYWRYERGENMKIISLFRLLSHHNLGVKQYFMQVDSKIKRQKKNQIKILVKPLPDNREISTNRK